MYIFVRICKFKNFERKSYFKKNVIAIAIAQNVPLYGQTLINQYLRNCQVLTCSFVASNINVFDIKFFERKDTKLQNLSR